MIKQSLLQTIRRNRRNPLFRVAASAAEKYLRAYNNQDHWRVDYNGEARVGRIVADALRGQGACVLDVGANVGHWAEMIHDSLPDATIHCFEIVPAIFEELERAVGHLESVNLHPFGLSDEPGTVQVSVNDADSSISSITPREGSRFFTEGTVRSVDARVETGDAFVKEAGLGRIDMLKIDVEGHELRVLRGFSETLNDPVRRPRFIQFEYGDTYLPAGANLFQVSQILDGAGYVFGRIFPEHVEFRAYSYADDHFRMGNYICAQSDDPIVAKLR